MPARPEFVACCRTWRRGSRKRRQRVRKNSTIIVFLRGLRIAVLRKHLLPGVKIGSRHEATDNPRRRDAMKQLILRSLIAPMFFCCVAWGSLAQAQDKSLKKIHWGVTSLSASNWIPWIAKDAKIYEKNGLDVELILVKGSGQTSTAILGGSLFAAPVAVPTTTPDPPSRLQSSPRRQPRVAISRAARSARHCPTRSASW